MESSLGIILLITVVATSLGVVSFANRIQTRNRLIRQRVSQLRKKIGEMEELCVAIEPLVESNVAPKLINDEVISTIEKVLQLAPNATYLHVNLKNAKQLAEQYASGHRGQELNRLMPSDAAIAKSKFYINEAAKIIRHKNGIGQITAGEMESIILELSWANLMVDVISHIGHGHKAVHRSDHVVAYGYYRKAQNMLINSNMSDDRRHQFIRELGEILGNKRSTISDSLMPEKELDPRQNTLNLPSATEMITNVDPSAPLVSGNAPEH